MEPKVSIIMSVYNGAEYLKEAIDSIIAQEYKNWEFVICNDGSTDNTQEILDEYKARLPEHFILLKNEQNRRLPHSLNKCLKYCNGELIARMDGDDICPSDRLRKQVSFLQNHPDFQLVGTQMRRFDDHGMHDIVSIDEFPAKEILKRGVTFCHATIMTYKYVYDQLHGYNETIPRSQDYDLWFRFYHHGFKGYNIQEPLYYVREDIHAIRRRTIRNRWDIMKLQYHGYHLLHFPFYWYGYPVIQLLKFLIPAWGWRLFRGWQANHSL